MIYKKLWFHCFKYTTKRGTLGHVKKKKKSNQIIKKKTKKTDFGGFILFFYFMFKGSLIVMTKDFVGITMLVYLIGAQGNFFYYYY